MNVKIETERRSDGWRAFCGTVEATRATKKAAVAACREAIVTRLSAETAMPVVVPAPALDRAFVVVADPDGGALVMSVKLSTGRGTGSCYMGHSFARAVHDYREHAASAAGADVQRTTMADDARSRGGVTATVGAP